MGVPKDFFLQQLRYVFEQILLLFLQKGFKVFKKTFGIIAGNFSNTTSTLLTKFIFEKSIFPFV